MWATNLKIVAIVLGTIGLYTLIANAIPQIESEVPREISFTGELSAAQLIEAGQELYEGAGGCTACHGLGTRAPNLLEAEPGLGEIGTRCGERVEGQDCKTYLYTSMVDPGAYVVEGYQPIMPDVRRTLSEIQIWALVAFMQSRGGEVTVTAEDLEAAGAGGEAGASGTAGPAGPSGTAGPVGAVATLDPQELLVEMQCLNCHVLGDQGVQVGPPFTDIGARRDPEHIRRSILDPAADMAEGYEQFAGVMPTNFGERLTAAQLEAIVTYLAEQR